MRRHFRRSGLVNRGIFCDSERGMLLVEKKIIHSFNKLVKQITQKMKLCTILVALSTLLHGTFAAIIPQFGSPSGEFGEFEDFGKKVMPPFIMSKRVHVTVEHETFCENFRSGADLMFQLDLDGEEQHSVKVPPQVLSGMQVKCMALRGVSEVKPVSMKIRANVVEKDSGKIIMRNEVRISNGVGALVPVFSTFALALLLLALFSKSY